MQMNTERWDAGFMDPLLAGTRTGCLLDVKCTGIGLKEHLMIELPAWGGQNVSHHGGPCTEASLTNTGSSLLQHGPFDCAMWTQIRESSMYSDKDYDAWDESACFALESPVGDQGYPGHVRVEAFVGVQSSGATSAMELGRIHVEYRARLVDDATTCLLYTSDAADE